MLNDGGNENGKTNTQTRKKQYVSLATTKKNNNNFTRAAHFFLHFFVVVLHDYSVKLSSYTFHGGNVRLMFSPKILFLVFLLAFFLTAAHFHHTGR